MKQIHTYNPLSNLEKKNFSTKWIAITIFFVCLFFILTSVVSIHLEKKHSSIKSLYADAFVEYAKINLTSPYSPENKKLVEKAQVKLLDVINKKTSFIENYYALYNIANLSIYMKNYSQAISYLEEFKNANPHNIVTLKALANLGQLYEKQKLYDKAIKTYSIIRNKTDNKEKYFATYHLALLFTKQNKLKKAIDFYQRIPQKSTLGKIAHRNITIIQALSGKISSE